MPRKLSYPLYLVSETDFEIIESAAELEQFESWIFYKDDTDPDWKMRAFDADHNRLAFEEIPWSGGQFRLFIDSKTDPRSDAATMQNLLLRLLTDHEALDPQEAESLPLDQLLPIAINHFKTKPR